MSKNNIRGAKLSALLWGIGAFLLIAAVLWVLVFHSLQDKNAREAKRLAKELYSLMPPIQDSFPDGRADTSMASIELGGADFAGVIEIPAYKACLPIYGKWDKSLVDKYPCRYTGSVYDASLIIGGSDNNGQFDFMKIITGGDKVLVTDTSGERYTYTVTRVKKTKDVSTKSLQNAGGDLILFARNTYSLDYTVVICSLKG
ncbi:MAG: sortase [Ruminococcaceae bacterium]|nr:sortase [Oscillospiraceae bacterium]